MFEGTRQQELTYTNPKRQRGALADASDSCPIRKIAMPALLGYVLLFLVVGVGFILVHLLAGKLIRPAKPDAEKLTIYECGEPTIGSAWVQFDLRFYVVALLFVIFDVEVAFFFPWAVVFGKATTVATAGAEDDSPRLRQAKVELLQRADPDRPMPEPRDLQV